MFAASTKLTAYGVVARNRQHCQTKEPATILRTHKLIGTSISEKNIILKCIKKRDGCLLPSPKEPIVKGFEIILLVKSVMSFNVSSSTAFKNCSTGFLQ